MVAVHLFYIHYTQWLEVVFKIITVTYIFTKAKSFCSCNVTHLKVKYLCQFLSNKI